MPKPAARPLDNDNSHDGTPHQDVSTSLVSSIFGNVQQDNNHKNDDLFSSSTEPLAKKPCFEKKPIANVATRSSSPKDVLALRRKRCESKQSMDTIKSITVKLSDYIMADGTQQCDDDDDENELRLFAGKCASVLSEAGVLILDSDQDKSLFPSDVLHQVALRAHEIQDEVYNRLEKVGETKWRTHDSPFSYLEVASRCRGRLDVRYQTNQPPFTTLLETTSCGRHIASIVHKVLGKDAKLLYMALIYSTPRSANQPWHQDGTPLFPEVQHDLELPPYALNVFCPLADITLEMGPTEFLLKSHSAHSTRDIHELLQQQDDEMDDCGFDIIAPLLKFGGALFYDYRTCHRGTSNLSSNDTTRPMLYMIYARPWFQEHLNFGTKTLFDKDE